MRDRFRAYFHALRKSKQHWLRKIVGGLLVIGGVLGFLPILGFWMLPLGLALLAVDFPFVRRLNRWLLNGWNNLRGKAQTAATKRDPSDK